MNPYDLDAPAQDEEVILFCIARGGITRCFARRHWFVEMDEHNAQVRREGWQSTWDGSEIPRDWQPYAWAQVDAPDPAALPAPLDVV